MVLLEVIITLGVWQVARYKGYPPSHPFPSDQNDDGLGQMRVVPERGQACSRAAVDAPAVALRRHSKLRGARTVVAAAAAAVSAPVPAGTAVAAASAIDDAG